ncbi:MAG: PH domain-containing protein [candidate division WWE3 bacterium]|nr:PH domain-containing protein [candidate division WWE3 bacterium]
MKEVFAALIKKPISVSFQSQEEGEALLMLVRRHWFTQVGSIITILILAAVPLVAGPFAPRLLPFIPGRFITFGVIFWLLFVFAYSLETFIIWYFNVLIITKKRIVDVDFWGLLNKNVSETEIAHLEDCTYAQHGVFQSLLNYGSVSMQTAGEQREFEFEGAPDPAQVHDLITDLMAGTHGTPKLSDPTVII